MLLLLLLPLLLRQLPLLLVSTRVYLCYSLPTVAASAYVGAVAVLLRRVEQIKDTPGERQLG